MDEYLDLDPLATRIETHRSWSERPDVLDATVRDLLGPLDGARLVDLGCGTAAFLRDLAGGTGGLGTPRTLVGVDTSPAARRAAVAAGAHGVGGDAVALPLRDGSVDVARWAGRSAARPPRPEPPWA